MTEVLSQDEIEQLLVKIHENDEDDIEKDFEGSPDMRRIKIYDFKRPDKFSKEQIRTISMMFDNFSRLTTTSLSAQLRSMVHVHVASVDQLTYEEFIRSIPSPTTLAIINMDPLKGNAILEIDPAISFSIIDRLAGGTGEGTRSQHELTDIEASIMEGIIVRMLGNLRESWTNVIDLRPRLGQLDTNPQFAQIAQPSDMAVLVTLETRVNDVEGMINYCIPYFTIESILEKFSTQYWFNKILAVGINSDRPDLDNILVTLRAELFRTEMKMSSVSTLKYGSTINVKEFQKNLIVNNTIISSYEETGNKIKLGKINRVLGSNYMEQKNNVSFTEGALGDIKVQIIAELGRTAHSLNDISNYVEGTILELNKIAGEPVDVFANNVLIAKGEVVVIDENFGVRLTEIIKKDV